MQKFVNYGKKLVGVVTSRNFMVAAGMALASSVMAHATSTGLPWESPLQSVRDSLTGPIAGGAAVIGVAGGSLGLIFGGELNEWAKRACYIALAVGGVVGANVLVTTFGGSSGALIF